MVKKNSVVTAILLTILLSFFSIQKVNAASCPVPSSNAGKVIVNEVSFGSNGEDWLELYVNSGTHSLNGWNITITTNGNKTATISLPNTTLPRDNSNSGRFLVIAASIYGTDVVNGMNSGALTYNVNLFIDSTLNLHNTIQDIIITDNNDDLVYYLGYANQSHQLNYDCVSQYPDYSDSIIDPGNTGQSCTITDGVSSGNQSGDWNPGCDGNTTIGGPNIPSSGIDHYEITHDAIGSNCASESVTIKACVDSACSSLYTSPTSLNFQADGITKSSPSFTGSTSITFDHTVAETLTLSVDSPSVSPDNALVCKAGIGTSCDIVFNACASCIAVFPAGYNQATSSNEQLANFPINNSAVTLLNSTTLPRGESFYLDSVLDSSDEITVGPVAGGETSARLYLSAGVLWDNTKINQSGNPEDLIIVVDGAVMISGASTVINAIIYVKGTVSVSGGGTINGAITSVGGGSGSANFNASYISNADFNGMCDATPVIDHYEIHHDNVGTTCGPEQITVKACIDSACSFLSSEAVTLNFQADGVTKNALSFTGSTTFTFEHTTAETLSLSADSPSITANNALKCIDGASNSCDTEFFTCPNCTDVFGSGLSTFNGRTAYVDANASITNQNSTALTTSFIGLSSGASCNGATCTASGTNAATMVKPSFINPSYSIPADGQLSGDYIITGEKTLSQTNLSIVGPTRIYVTDVLNINQSIANNSDASELIIFAEGNVIVNSSDLQAYVYSNGFVDLKNSSVFKGAFTGGADAILQQNASLEYLTPTSTNFTGMCIPSAAVDSLPIASFQFDACQDLDNGDSLVDSIGNYNGEAWQTPIESEHVVGLSADYSATSYTDFSYLPNTLLDSVGNFSLSFWLNVQSFTYDQTILSARKSSATDSLSFKLSLNSDKASMSVEIEGTSADFNLSQTLAVNSWHQFSVRRLGDEICIYLDGAIQECKTVSVTPFSMLNYGFLLGQEIVPYQQAVLSNKGLTSYIDEMLFYHTGVTDSLINSVYTNQLAGKNHDGTERQGACLIGNWQFENDFLDAIISDPHNLSPVNNPLFGISNPGPANTTGSQSTCNYVKFDGSNYASVDDTGAFNTNQLTVSAWVYPTSNPSSGLRSLVSKDEHFEFHINSSGKLYWWWRNASNSAHTLTSNATIPLNTWTHVAVVFTNGSQNMYVNGVLDTNSSHSDGLADSPCNFYIGTDVATNTPTQCGGVLTSRNYQGYMDEVKIYTRALPLVEIQADMNVVHSCSALGVDHYRLELTDNQGLTCEPENMLLKACADSSCSNLVSDSSTVDLSPSPISAATKWNPSENHIFSEQQAFTFSNTTATDISYGLDSATPSASFRCFVGGTEVASLADCKTSFSDVGFRYVDGSGNALIIQTQLSGKPSNIGYHAQDMFLQAVKTDDDTGTCTGAFPSGTDTEVKLSYSCHADSSACTDKVRLTNNSNNYDLDKLDTPNTPYLIRFDADSKAQFYLTYPDAGKILINAQADIDVDGLTKNIAKSTDPFVVRPFGFKLDFSQDTDKANALSESSPGVVSTSGTVFKKAGDMFKLTATAMQWSVGNDSDIDGIPDDTDFNSLNNVANIAVAKHFSDVFFDTTHNLILPSGGAPGTLTKNTGEDFSTTNNSVATNDYKYSEVGIIGLDVSLNGGNYLSSGNVLGKIDNIGRFIPAIFEVEADSNSITRACITGDFSYFSQPFSVSYTLQAKNGTNDITLNYKGDFVKEDIIYWLENEAAAPDYQSGSDLASRLSATTPNKSEWGLGELAINDLSVTFNRDTQEAPYVDTGFLISIENSEGGVLAGNQDHLNLGGVNTPAFRINAAPLEFRYGRLALLDTYGSEFDTVQVPMRTEHFDGTNFILNRDDSCSEYGENLAQKLPLSPSLTFDIEGSATNEFSNGTYDGIEGLFVDPLGVNQQGNFLIEYITTPLWLQFDWEGDGSQLHPQGNIQFGRYRGNDRVIYWREQ